MRGPGWYVPIAVQTAVLSDPLNQDLSGAAVAYVSNKRGYYAWRVSRDGRIEALHTLGVIEAAIDEELNREPHLAVGRTGGSGGVMREGWAFQVASGVHASDTNGGYGRTIACTNQIGFMQWETFRNGNAGAEPVIRCVDLHPDEDVVRTLGTNWRSVPTPPIHTELHLLPAIDGRSGQAEQFNDSDDDPEVEDVLDLEPAHQGEEEYVYVLGDLRFTDGFVLNLVDGELQRDPPLVWRNTLTTNDTDQSAVVSVDSEKDAIVALRSEKASPATSTITLRKLSWDDGTDAWSSPVTWSSAGTASMEVMEIAVDGDDNIYIAGRFEGEPGLVKFPADPTSASDREWLYTFPDDGGGLARAFDIDDEEACLYVTGHVDAPADGTSEQQMIVACLSPDGDVLYEHVLDVSQAPISALGAEGFSIDAATDPYAYGTEIPFVYALGRLAVDGVENLPHLFALLRFPPGGCAAVHTPESLSMAPSPWRVRGGSSLEVTLSQPAASRVRVQVFDVSGRRVAARVIAPGSTSLRVDGLAPSVYFLRAIIGPRTYDARAVVVR